MPHKLEQVSKSFNSTAACPVSPNFFYALLFGPNGVTLGWHNHTLCYGFQQLPSAPGQSALKGKSASNVGLY